MHPCVPGLQEHDGGSGYKPPPLFRIKEHDDEENAGEDESMHVDEVPDPRNADGVAIARCANQRRDVAGVVLCRPDSIAGNFKRRKPDPFASRRAVVIEIETRMIDQDGEPAADQHHDKKKIEEMAITDPERKTVRSSEVVWIDLGDWRNVRQPGDGNLDPGCSHYRQNR